MPEQGTRHRVGVLLKASRSGVSGISARHDAQASFQPGGVLPFHARSVESVCLSDAVATLAVRDQIQLLIECRRVLVPDGTVLCAEDDAPATHAALSRWAELVGLVHAAAPHAGRAWRKRAASAGTAPLVSILIPSSNPRYFLECLDSAIAQTYPRTEIIICDDSEGDVIERLVESRVGRAVIRYEKNPRRLRARGNTERCLSLARGEYIKYLNDDDVLEPECVATLLGAFLRIPDLVLATSHRWRINQASQVIEDMEATRPAVNRDLVIDGVTLANAVIMYGMNFIGEPSTALFRRRDFEKRPELDMQHLFHFNGEPVKVKGTCNHQDHAGVGAALPDAVQYYRIRKLQEMGCNSLRTSHNPPTPELLDACDELGMLVFDETRMMSSNPEGLSQFENLVRRDRNHPSVFMWSMGNEEGTANSERGVGILTAMKATATRHDGSRPVSIAPTGAICAGP